MADITVTAAQVGLVDPLKATVKSYVALEAITKGQAVCIDATYGKVVPADENDAGHLQFRGIALNAAGIGGAVDVVEDGELYGFTLAGDYDSIVYLSATAGALADSGSVICGRVAPLTDASLTKVLRVFAIREVDQT